MSLKHAIKDTVDLKNELIILEKKVIKAINLMYKTIKSKRKIFICGNGGSAADAQHLAAEFLVRLRSHVNRKPYPVISLAQDTSTITACGNDLGYENIFSRNLQALSSKNDLLIVLSTSGNSKNILKVLNMAKKIKVKSIAFLGNKGGKSKNKSDLELIIPSKNTARIQECQMFLGHYIFQEVEDLLININ